MAVKIGNIGEGGSGVSTRDGDSGTLKEVLLAIRAELDDMRTQHAALLAKLDADTTLDDSDYVATLAHAAATFSA